MTTHLIVATEFLDEHPDVVKALLEGQRRRPIDFVNDDPAEAQTARQRRHRGDHQQAARPTTIIAGAWENLTFTLDPIASSLQKSADDADAVGLLETVDLNGIYDLTLLNEVLAERGPSRAGRGTR